MENLFSNPLELKLYGMEWNWNGIGMEISPQMKSIRNGMEMDWKWNGNFITKKKRYKVEWNLNGNGMDINGHPDMEVKLNGMEWKRKGNEMERL